MRIRRSWLFYPLGHRAIKAISPRSGKRAGHERARPAKTRHDAKRVVNACPKDHQTLVLTPLKFDRTCDFDIMCQIEKGILRVPLPLYYKRRGQVTFAAGSDKIQKQS